MDSGEVTLLVRNLSFRYNEGSKQILSNINLELKKGQRCLLLGANGTGKTTLLRVTAGKHHLANDEVLVLGHSAYHHTPIGLTFLGGEWANNPNVRKDVVVSQLLKTARADSYPERRDYLLNILDIDPSWHMHQVSDGERRRVQLLIGLVKPFKVLLLDEVTIDLDVLVRQDLLNFLHSESEKYGATILYATHILDGLGDWPTHLAHLSNGKLLEAVPIEKIEELNEIKKIPSFNSPLLRLVEKWLRVELEEKRKTKQNQNQSQEPDLLTRLAYSDKTDHYYNYWS